MAAVSKLIIVQVATDCDGFGLSIARFYAAASFAKKRKQNKMVELVIASSAEGVAIIVG